MFWKRAWAWSMYPFQDLDQVLEKQAGQLETEM